MDTKFLMAQRADQGSSGGGVGDQESGRGPARSSGAAPSVRIQALAWSSTLLFVASLGFFLYSYAVRFGADVRPGTRLRSIAIDVGLFSLFALHHSLFARTRFKAWVRRVVPSVLERSLYTAIASLLFLAVCW